MTGAPHCVQTRARTRTRTHVRVHTVPARPARQKAQHRATQTKGVGYSHVGRTQSTPSGTGWAVRGVLLLSTLYTWLAKCKPGSAGGRGRLKAAYPTCKPDEGVDIFGLNTYRWCRYAHGNAQAHCIQCTARAPCRWCGSALRRKPVRPVASEQTHKQRPPSRRGVARVDTPCGGVQCGGRAWRVRQIQEESEGTRASLCSVCPCRSRLLPFPATASPYPDLLTGTDNWNSGYEYPQ